MTSYRRAMTVVRRSALFDAMVAGLVALLALLPLDGLARLGVGAGIGLGMAAALLVRRRCRWPCWR